MGKKKKAKELDFAAMHPWWQAAMQHAALHATWAAVSPATEDHHAWKAYFDRIGYTPRFFNDTTLKAITLPCQNPAGLNYPPR